MIRFSLKNSTDDEIDIFLKTVRKQSNYYIYGYYEQEKLVGLIIYNIENETAKIDVISVENDERGKGIGTKIINMVHEKRRNIEN